MAYPVDLSSLIQQNSKYKLIQYTEPDLVLTIHAAEWPFHPDPTKLSVVVTLNRSKSNRVDFETELETGRNRDYTLDGNDEECLISEMKTFLIRIQGIRDKGQQITGDILFAPEIESEKIHREESEQIRAIMYGEYNSGSGK